jgi:hypothetical protein
MFGFLKNIFGGIFGFLGKLLGFGKKSEYALEFESNSAAKTIAPSKPAPKAEVSTTAAKSAKVEKATTTQEKPVKAETPAPAPVKKPEPAKAPTPVGGFSTQYLTSSTSATRRRPGANMNSYLDMARQVKTTR